MRHNTLNENAARGEGQTHVRYLEPVKFFNSLRDVEAGEVLRVTRHLGKGAAWLVRDNGDTWAEIGIDGKRAEYFTPPPAKPLNKSAAIKLINALPGMVARSTYPTSGDAKEIRVTYRNGSVTDREAAAYYTDDAQDAWDTAQDMARRATSAPVIAVEIETANPSDELRGLVSLIVQRNDNTRDAVADVVRSWGFRAHTGGRHVAIIAGEARVAIVTHPTAPDFN